MKATSLLLIGLGGALGSILRALCSYWLRDAAPWGTFVVNASGSLLIGLLIGLSVTAAVPSEPLRLFGVIGFCGGFTTFSTFSYENVVLLQQGKPLLAFAYMGLSMAACIGAVYAGLRLGRLC